MNSSSTYRFLFFCLVFSLMASACIERIDIPNARQAGQVNIYGQLTPTNDAHKLYVGLTSENNRITEPVLEADVRIFDDLGNEAPYSEWERGEYRLYPSQIERLPGRTYHIQVTLPNGKTYRSLPAKMPLTVGSDSAYWEVTPNKRIEVYVDSKLPQAEEPYFLRWVVEQNYIFEPTDFPDPFNSIPPPCFVWEYPNRQSIITHDGSEARTDFLPNKYITAALIDHRFKSRHYFLVEQLSITRDAFEYWEKVKQTVNRTGSIFDTPPAAIPGNLYNVNDPDEDVLGYFEVANTDTSMFFVVPGYFDFNIPRYCEYYPSVPRYNYYPRECLNCLSLKNSSYEKPLFWP